MVIVDNLTGENCMSLLFLCFYDTLTKVFMKSNTKKIPFKNIDFWHKRKRERTKNKSNKILCAIKKQGTFKDMLVQ